jgi:hypothetical protein
VLNHLALLEEVCGPPGGARLKAKTHFSEQAHGQQTPSTSKRAPTTPTGESSLHHSMPLLPHKEHLSGLSLSFSAASIDATQVACDDHAVAVAGLLSGRSAGLS